MRGSADARRLGAALIDALALTGALVVLAVAAADVVIRARRWRRLCAVLERIAAALEREHAP